MAGRGARWALGFLFTLDFEFDAQFETGYIMPLLTQKKHFEFKIDKKSIPSRERIL
jgi:hypothetical protein